MKATCAVCRRHRVIMADTQLCLACAVGLTHRCPICQDDVPGSGHAPCYPCSQRRRANRQIATERETIRHPWLAELFSDFCTSGKIPLETGNATDRIARAAAACRRIAVTVTNPTDLSTETLHAALGAESLRRVAPLIAHWAEVGVIEWDRARLQTLIERDRVTAILTTHAKSPHASLLHRYRDHLAIRDRKPITQRTALTAAVTLLAALGDAPISDLSQRHVTKMLRARPGHRAALQGFLSFLASEGGPKLTIAKPRRDPVARERRLRADIRACRKRLATPRTATEARALIAVLIARIYALPLNRVLSLTRPEVALSMSGVTLWPDGEALTLDRSLAVAFQEWISVGGLWRSPGNPWVFPGRDGHQPMSEAAVAYHVNAKRTGDRPGLHQTQARP
jgi:hypothetical protein